MLNALSTAMFALTLRVGSESNEAAARLLALAGHPRIAPAWQPCFRSRPARGHCLSWHVCGHMSRADFGTQFPGAIGGVRQRLLTDIRMTLAANELRKSSRFHGGRGGMVG